MKRHVEVSTRQRLYQEFKSMDATGLSRGVSRSQLYQSKNQTPDATGLPRGVSRSRLHSCERETSTAQGRGIQAGLLAGV